MEAESPEANPSPQPDAQNPDAPRLIAMIEHDGQEPPRNLTDRQAEGAWAAVSAIWHPALLALCEALPGISGIAFPDVPEPREVRVLAEGVGGRLQADYRQVAQDAGAKLVDGGIDRAAIARDVLLALGQDDAKLAMDDPLVGDFLALGTAFWFLRDLTTAMGHADTLDYANLTREAIRGARAWRDGDAPCASGHLRAAFELLTQARERFYPVEAYLIDICLLDASFPAGALADPLSASTPVTFLGTAQAFERIAENDPERLAAIRQAVNDGWADVIGGTYTESDEALQPITSIFWQFLKASEVYRRHLDDRNVETLATRRFALYPMRPQLARRFGFRYGIHLAFDAGVFPVPRESKRLWEASDSSHLETLTRPPLAADRPSEGLRLPWRIGRSMKDDHVATVPMLHWPSPVAGWYRDLRRVASYSPVLSRWATMGDYFHMSDRPWEMFGPTLDEYVTPYLSQAVARGDQQPITARASHARKRAILDSATSLDALYRALTATTSEDESDSEARGPLVAADLPFAEIETALEMGGDDHESFEIDHEPTTSRASGLSRAICDGSTGSGTGDLVLNPTGVSRRVAVVVGGHPTPGGPVRAVQTIADRVHAVVDLPPFGFAWIPREGPDAQPSSRATASDATIKNDLIEVEIDRATGGIRSVRAKGESTARIGQQLVVVGLDGGSAASRMEATSVEVISAGPGLAQITSRGRVVHGLDGRTLAGFTQTMSLWGGRSTLDLSVTFDDIDAEWFSSLAEADPWTAHLACRWAWPDSASTLRRTSLMSMLPTKVERPETPDAIEIASRERKTTLLFGGLAHHQRHGERMLDTLLVAGRETGRHFQLGIALDLEHAFHAAVDFVSPALVVPSQVGPPRVGPTGWLLHVESAAVHVPRIEFLEHMGDGRGWGLAVYLVETSGRAIRSRLRLFKNPIDARQTDFAGELVIDLHTEGDAVPFDLTPHEMVRVEVRLG